jgi:phosphoribosyl-ATP pyrophosphohydrolase/phosphoribosyl-AMP cyclohydrolase
MKATFELDSVKFNEAGLVPCICQDYLSGRVLMLGYMNHSSIQETLDSGRVTFFSRSRSSRWVKGETSGNYLEVIEFGVDCDNDALLCQVIPAGPTCHTGSESCFPESAQPFVGTLMQLIAERHEQARAPASQGTNLSYLVSLFQAGKARIAQKVGEEGVEVALASVTNGQVCSEGADLFFHLLVLLEESGITWKSVVNELRLRHKLRKPQIVSD